MARIETRQTAAGTARFRVSWREGGGRDGARQSHTFTDGKAAERFRKLVEGHGETWPPGWRQQQSQPDTGAPTVDAFLDVWLASRSGVQPATLADDRRMITTYVLPYFTGVRVDAISRLDIGTWVAALERTESSRTKSGRLSAKTIQNIHGAFSTLLDATTRTMPPLRPDNPAKGIKLPEPGADADEATTFLTPAEFQLLRSCITAPKARDLATALVGTGLRWSEATALQVADVDLLATTPRLHVRRAWKRQDNNTSTYLLGGPKSKRSRRTVTFSGDVLDALLPHLAGKAGDELVFANSHGGMWRNNNWHDNVWQPAVDRAQALGLAKDPRPHDLRHTHASWLIAAGRPAASIQRRLGHESIDTTINRYGHLMPDVDDGDVAALDDALAILRTTDALTS